MLKPKKLSTLILLFALGSIPFVGCSNNGPLQSTESPVSSFDQQAFVRQDLIGQEVKLAGRVRSIDPNSRTLTLAGLSDFFSVAPNAESVQKDRSIESRIELTSILVGDSVELNGAFQVNGSFLATRVVLYLSLEQSRTDIKFAGVISSIDYKKGYFSVENRFETIHLDGGSTLFKRAARRGADRTVSGGDSDPSADDNRWKETISIIDLAVGDVVEVYANKIDETSLYAVILELVDDGGNIQVRFNDYVQLADPGTRTVTFQTSGWTGTVPESAILIGPKGEELALDQFATGEPVEVVGFQVGKGSIGIVQMKKTGKF